MYIINVQVPLKIRVINDADRGHFDEFRSACKYVRNLCRVLGVGMRVIIAPTKLLSYYKL